MWARRRRSRSAPSSRGRVEPAESRAAVAGVTTTCPASATFSASAVAEAPGPRISSSRVGEPTRKRWMSPECTPTDIDRDSRPTDVRTLAESRSAARISTAASHACSGWSGPRKRKSRASPPNFSSSPPRAALIRSIGEKTRFSVSTISSAPIRPRRERRSVRAVNPETSAKTRVPSTTRPLAPGASWSHRSATGGTWRRRSGTCSVRLSPGLSRWHRGVGSIPHARRRPADRPSAATPSRRLA